MDAADAKTLGLVAGSGDIALAIARDARAQGRRLVTVALKHLASPEIETISDVTGWYNVGKLGGIIRFLRKNGASEAVFAGKVPKSVLYDKGGVWPDFRAIGVLLKLRSRQDDTIINTIADEFRRDGITLLDMRDFCRGMLTPEGVLTRKGPSHRERKDIEFGFRMAKGIGDLDIGQTVVVKAQAVMAVEAIEGTDEAIRRGGALAGAGAVVVKVARPKQDMRFDVPVIGTATLESMHAVGARVLAAEAGESILMDRENFLTRAKEYGITVVGVKNGTF
jgi:DUF1009 family protein